MYTLVSSMGTLSDVYSSFLHGHKHLTVFKPVNGLVGKWCLMPPSTIFQLCSVLLVEETGENHRPVVCHWQTFITYCYIKYTSPWTGFDLSTLVIIGIDCTRSCKSSYLAITTTTLLPVNGIPNPLLILNGSSMWCRYTVEQQTRKNSNFPVRGIFKNPREIIVNIFR